MTEVCKSIIKCIQCNNNEDLRVNWYSTLALNVSEPVVVQIWIQHCVVERLSRQWISKMFVNLFTILVWPCYKHF